MTLVANAEPGPSVSNEAQDLHRAVASLMEELDAIDRYNQRAESCTDPTLRAVLIHNKREEIEHAVMLVEWLRRADPIFDAHARRLLFTSGAIAGTRPAGAMDKGPPVGEARSLGLGSLRGAPWTS